MEIIPLDSSLFNILVLTNGTHICWSSAPQVAELAQDTEGSRFLQARFGFPEKLAYPMTDPCTLWWTNSLPWKDPPFLIGKSTISTGPCSIAMLVHQRVCHIIGVPWIPSRNINIPPINVSINIAAPWIRHGSIGFITVPSGKRINITIERSTIFHGKIHYFYGHVQ